jgi:feruloyl esterase
MTVLWNIILTNLNRVDWVEKGVVPDILDVDQTTLQGVKKSRILCPYPQKAKYRGIGSRDARSSYHCDSPK